jgi:hypothetical protein
MGGRKKGSNNHQNEVIHYSISLIFSIRVKMLKINILY